MLTCTVQIFAVMNFLMHLAHIDNPCESNPCVEGVCRNNETDYICQCLSGFVGVNCSTGRSTVGSCHTEEVDQDQPNEILRKFSIGLHVVLGNMFKNSEIFRCI